MHNLVSVDEEKTFSGINRNEMSGHLSADDGTIDKHFKFSKKTKTGA